MLCTTKLITQLQRLILRQLLLMIYYAQFIFPANILVEFYIRVGTTLNSFNAATFNPTSYTQCWYQQTPIGTNENEFSCNSVIVGQYVAIHFASTKTEHLTLCQVKVFSDISKFTAWH